MSLTRLVYLENFFKTHSNLSTLWQCLHSKKLTLAPSFFVYTSTMVHSSLFYNYLFPCMPFPYNHEQLKRFFVFFIGNVHMSILINMVRHLQCLVSIHWINEWINKLANEGKEVARLLRERKPGTQRAENHTLTVITIQIFQIPWSPET